MEARAAKAPIVLFKEGTIKALKRQSKMDSKTEQENITTSKWARQMSGQSVKNCITHTEQKAMSIT